MEAAEPGGQQVIPAGHHGEAGAAGDGEGGGADLASGQQQDDDGADGSGDAQAAESQAEHLRDGPDEVDLIGADERQHGIGAQDEHQGNDGRGDHHRASNRPGGVAALARQDGDVLKAAESAHGHLAEHIEAEERDGGQGEREGVIAVQAAAAESQERQQDENAEGEDLGDAPGVLDPFAHAEAERGDHRKAHHQDACDSRDE